MKRCMREVKVDDRAFDPRRVLWLISKAKNALQKTHHAAAGGAGGRLRPDRRRGLPALPAGAPRPAGGRLRRPDRPPGRAAQEGRGAAPEVPGPLQPPAGGRVPGHQPLPARAAQAAGRRAPERLRRGRRRPGHLRLARRRGEEHPALRAPLPGRQGGAAGAELPLHRPHPRLRQRRHRQERRAASRRSSGPRRRRRAGAGGGLRRARRRRPASWPRRSPGCAARGGPGADFAVLYRLNAQSRPIEEALREAQMPYQVHGGSAFFDRSEVRDLLAYLKVVRLARGRDLAGAHRQRAAARHRRHLAWRRCTPTPWPTACRCCEALRQAGRVRGADPRRGREDRRVRGPARPDPGRLQGRRPGWRRRGGWWRSSTSTPTRAARSAVGRRPGSARSTGSTASCARWSGHQGRERAGLAGHLAAAAGARQPRGGGPGGRGGHLADDAPRRQGAGVPGGLPGRRSRRTCSPAPGIQGEARDLDEERRLAYVGITRARELLYLTRAAAAGEARQGAAAHPLPLPRGPAARRPREGRSQRHRRRTPEEIAAHTSSGLAELRARLAAAGGTASGSGGRFGRWRFGRIRRAGAAPGRWRARGRAGRRARSRCRSPRRSPGPRRRRRRWPGRPASGSSRSGCSGAPRWRAAPGAAPGPARAGGA